MKIVVNHCYGGFSLSAKAVFELAKLKGKKCYFFKFDFKSKAYTKLSMEQANKACMFDAFSVSNPSEYLKYKKEWHEMTMEEKQEYNEKYRSIDLSDRPDDRTDKDLISVVEKLGKEANGNCAKLSIVEIPDDVDWEIDEYDGREHVAEKHRTW